MAELDSFLQSTKAVSPAESVSNTSSAAVSMVNTSGPNPSADVAIQCAALPHQIGRYLIELEIARGGMGVVYQAWDPELGRRAALKVIKSGILAGPEEVQRFQVEAQAAARLDHPGIVPVYEVGMQDGQQFLAMAFVDGRSLWDQVKAAPLEVREASRIMLEVAEAVQAAHDCGILHRDLKPQNILLAKDGQPRVTDFGLAKLEESDIHLTETGQTLGTPGFMPPEQALGRNSQIGATSDVYSLGATLYCLLTGRPPFQAATRLETLLQVVEQMPVPPRQCNSLIPVDLETICLKCLEKGPEKRYASAAELAAELKRFQRGEPIRARPLSLFQRSTRWCWRNPVVAGLLTILAASLLAGTSVSVYFAMLAQGRATRAEEGTRIAMETLETVIFQMQEKLSRIPAAREARTQILSQAMAELQKLSRLHSESRRVDLGTAAVLVRIANVIIDVREDHTLGALDTAAGNLQRACEIYSRCDAAEPHNLRIRSGWAMASLRAGDLAVTMNNTPLAKSHINQAIKLYRSLLVEFPDQAAEWTKLLSNSLIAWGDLKELENDLNGSLIAYRDAKQLSRTLRQQAPDDPAYLEEYINGVEKEADIVFRLGQYELARKLYGENLLLNQEYLRSDEQDPVRMMSVSTCYERMAEFEKQQGNQDVALDYFERELDITLRAVAADPVNQQYRVELSTALNKLAHMYQSMDRSNDAVAVQQRVNDHLASLTSAKKR